MSLDKTPLSLIKSILDNILQFTKRVYDLYGTKYMASLIKIVSSLWNKFNQSMERYCVVRKEDTLIFCYGSNWSAWDIPEHITNRAPWCVDGIKKVVFDPSFKDFQPHSTRAWFSVLKMLTSIEGLENLDTSKVTDMSCMFCDCSSLTTLDLSNFDTSEVTNMHSMFCRCSSLTNLDLSNFYTPKLHTMWSMFFCCYSLTTLDVSNFDTSKVTDMSAMFCDCSSLTTLDVSNFDTSKVTDMSAMFCDCSSLTTLDVSNFDTSKVTNMSTMFSGCSSLTILDLSNFNTSEFTNMKSMFSRCSSLATLYISSNFNILNVKYKENIFYRCYAKVLVNVNRSAKKNI